MKPALNVTMKPAADHRMEDSWLPCASLEVLRLRARMLQRIRAFFLARDVLEVETPTLSGAAATDPHLRSFSTRYRGPGAEKGREVYLHTSPEFAMKRLLASGSGPIYQICKVFRDAEAGRLHNPEFTMVEWYRVGIDYRRLMDETVELASDALDGSIALNAPEKISYREAFMRHCGLDPHTADRRALASTVSARGLGAGINIDGWGSSELRDLLLSHLVEPTLGRGRFTLLYDYPASESALARLRPGRPAVAERFELYYEGVEMANGFLELTDPVEQRARFERDLATRAARGLPEVPIDEHLIDALAHGLPDCGGVALGFDRLVMLAARVQSIQEAMAFPVERV